MTSFAGKAPAASVDVGTVVFLAAAVAGAAALEIALVPGVVIGAAAWFGPRAFAGLLKGTGRKAASPRRGAAFQRASQAPRRFADWAAPALTQSAAKTVTFRIISSGLDFGWNYLLLGEVATAASLSGISLIAAPTFYFLHEAVWHRYGKGEREKRPTFVIPSSIGKLPISRALAKTVTFRTFATVSEVCVNYFVVRDVVLAGKLSAFSIVAGPFVYIAHEKAWERFADRHGQSRERAQTVSPAALNGPSR